MGSHSLSFAHNDHVLYEACSRSKVLDMRKIMIKLWSQLSLQEFRDRQHHHFALLEKKLKENPSDFINNLILLPCENYRWISIANDLSSQKHVSALTEFVGIEHTLYQRCITAFCLDEMGLRLRKRPSLHTYKYWSVHLLYSPLQKSLWRELHKTHRMCRDSCML